MPIGKAMIIPPELMQFIGSLVAILALAGLAALLRLGRPPRLDSEAAVRRAAAEAVDGFVPVEIARDAEGRAALARDGDGRILLIKLHGNRFAGRILCPAASAREMAGDEPGAIEVDCGEGPFGKVVLAIERPGAWAKAINGLVKARNA